MKITDPSFSGTSVLSGSLNVSGSINLNGQALTVSLVPIYGSTSPTVLNSTASIQTLTVTGENFDGSAIGYVKGNNGTRYDPTTSIRNSDVQLTLNFSGSDRLTSANEPYDIYILNGNGENTFEENVVNVDASPVWQTPAGKIGEVYIGNSLTASFNISATDPDSNDTVSYFITGGALPTGMTFISSSGEISQSGEIVEQVSDTYSSSGVNYNTTFAATDSTSNVLRTFYITKKWRDGSSVDTAVANAAALTSIGVTDPGLYYLNLGNSQGVQQVYCLPDPSIDGGGWMVLWSAPDGATNYTYTFSQNTQSIGTAPLSGYYSLDWARRSGVTSVASADKTLVYRASDGWLRFDGHIWDTTVTPPGNWNFEFVTNCITSDGTTDSSIDVGLTNYNNSGGGDFGIASVELDHHSDNYYHLNASCGAQYLFQYGSGYKVNQSLSGWSPQTTVCNDTPSNSFAFLVAVK